MSEHLIAARAALADEIRDATDAATTAQARIDCANAALAALLYGEQAAVPMVRPPAPDVEQPAPVTVPKRETRPKKIEQRPAAKSRISSMQTAAKVLVDCPSCGKAFSQLGIGAHRKNCHPTPAPSPPVELEQTIPLTPVVNDITPQPTSPIPAAGQVLMCDECEFETDYRPGAAADMSQHTIKTHRRGPRTTERTPMPKGAAA